MYAKLVNLTKNTIQLDVGVGVKTTEPLYLDTNHISSKVQSRITSYANTKQLQVFYVKESDVPGINDTTSITNVEDNVEESKTETKKRKNKGE